jgi:hypothetical protein
MKKWLYGRGGLSSEDNLVVFYYLIGPESGLIREMAFCVSGLIRRALLDNYIT